MAKGPKSCKGEELPQVKLALEKSRCLPDIGKGEKFDSPQKIAAFALEHFGCEPQERMLALSLSSRNEILSVHEVGVGGVDQTLVDPRVLFAGAILSGASALVLVHNHPSGSPEPSALDLELTRNIARGALLFSIRLLDHIIIAPNGKWESMLQRGLIESPTPMFRGYGDEVIEYGRDESSLSGVDGIGNQCDLGHHVRCRDEECECWCHGRRAISEYEPEGDLEGLVGPLPVRRRR